MQIFEFTHGDSDSATTKLVKIDADATWMAVLNQFADFLASVYGFDIKDKLIVKVGGEYIFLRQQILDEALAEDF